MASLTCANGGPWVSFTQVSVPCTHHISIKYKNIFLELHLTPSHLLFRVCHDMLQLKAHEHCPATEEARCLAYDWKVWSPPSATDRGVNQMDVLFS